MNVSQGSKNHAEHLRQWKAAADRVRGKKDANESVKKDANAHASASDIAILPNVYTRVSMYQESMQCYNYIRLINI